MRVSLVSLALSLGVMFLPVFSVVRVSLILKGKMVLIKILEMFILNLKLRLKWVLGRSSAQNGPNFGWLSDISKANSLACYYSHLEGCLG